MDTESLEVSVHKVMKTREIPDDNSKEKHWIRRLDNESVIDQ